MNDAVQQGRAEPDKAELLRSNRELEDFAYVASHDLKSPLLVVIGFLEMLQRTKADQLDEDARMYVDAALRGAARMEQLIEGLLAYSRVGSGTSAPTTTDLGIVIADALADCEHGLREGGVAVVVGPMPAVDGDGVLLRQLFDNLLSNAVKFRRTDVPTIVDVDAVQRGREWLVRVTDNGVGIPRRHREHVFTMFSRLAPTTDRPGSGIGLAICQRVVQAHGGRIWVEDGNDGGAQLCFTLPA